MRTTEQSEGYDIGVVNYGAGNLGNVLRALTALRISHRLLENSNDFAIQSPRILLLPGVGAFRPAMEKLSATGWADLLKKWVDEGKPLVGICAGMQLLCRSSSEDGETSGLGCFDAEIHRLSGLKKIPHMGWNTVEWENKPDGRHAARNFYFVHSYAAMRSPDCIGTTEVDGVTFCSALRRDNVVGFQFHPERSGARGVDFLGDVLGSLLSKGDCSC
ncbi:imidazole glycerol phosphate synthase subunit HisH [Synergistaceae bacterium OttesenSCG-928-I11]|nr:imidazole glycerol phosphate synthase subunit HisH [Synergistaceae bacterium OttesenSCG-928-I11]